MAARRKVMRCMVRVIMRFGFLRVLVLALMSLTFGSFVAEQALVLEPTLALLPILAGYGFIFIKDLFGVGIFHMGRVISIA